MFWFQILLFILELCMSGGLFFFLLLLFLVPNTQCEHEQPIQISKIIVFAIGLLHKLFQVYSKSA